MYPRLSQRRTSDLWLASTQREGGGGLIQRLEREKIQALVTWIYCDTGFLLALENVSPSGGPGWGLTG